ncbi:hypothetical protein EBZ39_16660, partial [bacterium]|nr:hypothetical protein [bacterium]
GTVTANVVQNQIVYALDAFGSAYSNAFPVAIDQAGFGNVPISGTVTANTGFTQPLTDTQLRASAVPVSLTSVPTHGVTLASLPASTVTVSNFPNTQSISGTVTANISGTVPVSGTFWQSTQPVSLTSTTVTVSSLPSIPAGTAQIGSVTANISGTVPVSISSVTIGAMPNGTLTTRFGTPATASTAFLTTAVTNTSRKYLLIQNVTTASNVITVGIGFTPTTTQGIQLAAGAGITFESSYIPTGAVWVLSSVTASNFTILEA